MLVCTAQEVSVQQLPGLEDGKDAAGISDADTACGSVCTADDYTSFGSVEEEVVDAGRGRFCSVMTDDDVDAVRNWTDYDPAYTHAMQPVVVYPDWFALPPVVAMPPPAPGYFMDFTDFMVPVALTIGMLPVQAAPAALMQPAPAVPLQPANSRTDLPKTVSAPDGKPELTFAAYSTASEIAPSLRNSKTSLLLRNLPLGFTRSNLMDVLRAKGLAANVDFLYVPGKLKIKERGCAFVNLTTPEAAEECLIKFQGFTDWGVSGAKEVCEIDWCTDHQGLNAYIERYRNSLLMHESVDDEDKPALFENGFRIPFPTKDHRVRAPLAQGVHLIYGRVRLLQIAHQGRWLDQLALQATHQPTHHR